MTATDTTEIASTPIEEFDVLAPAASPLLPPSPRSGRRSVSSGRPSASGPLTTRNMERLTAQQGADPLFNLDKLRAVYDGMAAANGRITLDQLPFVLISTDIAASPKEIQDTIEQLLPDADDGDALIDFQQVETIYLQLCRDPEMPLEDPNEPTSPPALWQRAWRWLQRRYRQREAEQTAYERHMRPTTRLLLVILATATIISIGIVIFSIIKTFDDSVNRLQDHILREVLLLRYELDMFGYSMPLNSTVQYTRELSSLLGVMTEGLGYQSSRTFQRELLSAEQHLLTHLLDGWFVDDVVPRATVKTQLLVGCVQFLTETEGLAVATALANQLNPTLPAGQEVVLSRRSSPTAAPQYATQLRYRGQCKTTNCTTAGSLDTNSLAALNGSTGALFGVDYRQQPVVAGYAYVPGPGLGLVYNMELPGLRGWFAGVATAVINDINLADRFISNVTGKQNTHQYVLARRDAASGKSLITTAESDCDATCMKVANLNSNVLDLALNGLNGTANTQNLAGVNVTASYGPVPSSDLALAAETPAAYFQSAVLGSVVAALGVLDAALNVSDVQLAVADNSSANGLRILTALPPACNGTCATMPGTSPYLAAAVATCSEGVMDDVLDNQGVSVIAGYACVPSLHAGVAIKVKHQTITNYSLSLINTLLTYETDVRFASSTYEMYGAMLKPGLQMATTRNDIIRLNARKLERDCPNATCTGPATLLFATLSGQTGVMKALDYRNRMVYGAYTYLPSLKLGLLVKVDTSEADKDSMTMAGGLAGCCVVTLILSMLLLGWLTNNRLHTMDTAWDEGKEAIVREKQQFRNVIEAMYPQQVAQRLLAGESHIVYHVSNATVFFSDIYEFTTASNAISPDELIQFMGYTFGTMDVAAEHYGVHKVKTMGDAFLGVAGLPGSESLSGNTALDALKFASCCAQLFSTRYLHPESAAVLGLVARTLFSPTKKLGDQRKDPKEQSEEFPPRTKTTSQIQYDNPSISGGPPDLAGPSVQCVMRYGVASGPITAGVLQGKTPLFDIWGKTVNLASRMESSGVPGRVHLSESVHQAVANEKGQPFTFDSRHKVACKGFGSVNAYFINSCSLPPPKALLHKCHIQPNLGR
eukprot:EG_transcript_1391